MIHDVLAAVWHPPDWAEDVVFGAAFIGAVVTVNRYIITPIRRPVSRRLERALDHVLTEHSKPLSEDIAKLSDSIARVHGTTTTLASEVKELKTEVAKVRAETSYNGGSSMKDVLNEVLEIITRDTPSDEN